VKDTLDATFRTLKGPAFYKLKHLPVFYTVSFSQLRRHQRLPRPFSSQSSFLSYTNTYLSHVHRSPTSCPTPTLLSHVRRSPTSCTTPTLTSAMFVAVQIPVLHQHSSQPCSSQSNFLSYTNICLSHVRRSPTSCLTPTHISTMFVELQLPVLHQYSCQPCSSQLNFQSYTDAQLSSALFVPLGRLVLRNLID